MRRFAIFATVLAILVVIGSQPRSVAAGSKKSFCVCVASRAQLILRSITKTNTSTVASAEAPKQAFAGGATAAQ